MGSLISQLHWYDIVDILLVTYVVVWLYSWVKGTRAFRVLLGLGLMILIYLWAQSTGLFLTQYALQWLGQALLIFVLIIFAPEIRQVLERLNPMRIWNRPAKAETLDYVDEIIKALERLRRQSIGALLVIERSERIQDLIRSGLRLDGEVQSQILVSIFQPKSPTHDGAVWIRDGRIHEVGVFLPVSQSYLPTHYGSRHRAAAGVSELCDALVLVVSEERAEVSVVHEGHIRRVEDLEQLREELRVELKPTLEVAPPNWRNLLLREWRVKVAALAIVTTAWFMLAAQQNVQEEVLIAVSYTNLPKQYVLTSQPIGEVSVRLSGPRLSMARLDPEDLVVLVDLSDLTPGEHMKPVDTGNINTPPEVQVSGVDPQIITLEVGVEPGE